MALHLDSDPSRVRLGRDTDRGSGGGFDPTLLELAADGERDERRLRLALLGALVFHLVLFALHLPALAAPPLDVASGKKVFMVQTFRFEKPKPKAAEPIELPKPKARRIPIPDPTPDDPEPIRELEIESLDEALVDQVADAGDLFGIPDGPPSSALAGALAVGGDVLAPTKIYAPQPRYTEDARKARLEGVVILQTVVDEQGNVVDVKVLKGLGYGLSESAIETVRQWRFEPARRAGQPVAVYFMLTVSFSIQ